MKKKLVGLFIAMFLVFTLVPNIGAKTAKAGTYPYPELDLHMRWGEGEDEYMLYWDEVPGAYSYQISANGTGLSSKTNSVDMSRVIKSTGDYTPRIFVEKPNLGGFIGYDENGPTKHFERTPLDVPTNIKVENGLVTWDAVPYATYYLVDLVRYDSAHPYEYTSNNVMKQTNTNSISMAEFKEIAVSGMPYYISVIPYNDNYVENLHAAVGTCAKSKYFTYYSTYNVTTSTTSAYGTISGGMTVNHAGDYVVKLNPNPGYGILSLIVNGIDVTADIKDNQYTISNITEDTTVVVTYGLEDGWQKVNDKWMYIHDGEFLTGWVSDNVITMKYEKGIDFLGEVERDKWRFFVDPKGYIYDVQENTAGGWRPLNLQYGHRTLGISELDAPWYYFNDKGEMATGWKSIDGKWYYFGSSGKMAHGWKQIGTKTYYFDADGIMLAGWQKLDGIWYDFSSDGVMLTGWQKYNGRWYYFLSTGKMVTGWSRLNGHWYYFNSAGKMITGWGLINEKYYYFNSDGEMQTGWQKIDGKKYYFNEYMLTGWQKIDGNWYYFDDHMKTGWLKEDDEWYYLNSDGTMAKGWKYVNETWYYFEKTGVMVDGWKKINDVWYYFKNGAMVTGKQTIDGKKYTFSEYGNLLSIKF